MEQTTPIGYTKVSKPIGLKPIARIRCQWGPAICGAPVRRSVHCRTRLNLVWLWHSSADIRDRQRHRGRRLCNIESNIKSELRGRLWSLIEVRDKRARFSIATVGDLFYCLQQLLWAALPYMLKLWTRVYDRCWQLTSVDVSRGLVSCKTWPINVQLMDNLQYLFSTKISLAPGSAQVAINFSKKKPSYRRETARQLTHVFL